MKDVWESCQFSDEIISADFSKAKFAVELHEFLDGTADVTYQDPQTFFMEPTTCGGPLQRAVWQYNPAWRLRGTSIYRELRRIALANSC